MTDQLVQRKENKIFTTSRMVAVKFKKEHKNVLRAIQSLDCSEEFSRLNFERVAYLDEKNEKRPEYIMTRDGFTFLAMGFRGKEAAVFKEEYINAFNEAEKELKINAVHQQKSEDELLLDAMNMLTGRVQTQQRQIEQKNEQIKIQEDVIKEQTPDVEYTQKVLGSIGTHHTTHIAAELGLSAIALNKLLKDKGIQYKIDGHWVLSTKYKNKGYEDYKTTPYINSLGQPCTSTEMIWKERGRRFIHDLINPNLRPPNADFSQGLSPSIN